MLNIDVLNNSPLCTDTDFKGKSVQMKICKLKNHPIHFHKYLEIVYIFDGAVDIKLCYEHFYIEKGDFIIINPYEIHSIRSVTENTVMAYFHFEEDIFHGLSSILLWNPEQFKGEIHAYRKIKKNVMNIIRCEIDDVEEGLSRSAQNICVTLRESFKLVQFTRDGKKSKYPDTSFKLQLLDEMLKYLYTVFDEKVTLESIAQFFSISKYYLSHIVSEGMEISFKQLLNLVRSDKAEMYLLEENLSVEEICRRVGFSSVSYFNKSFQHFFGMSPAQYRKENVKNTIRYCDFDEELYDVNNFPFEIECDLICSEKPKSEKLILDLNGHDCQVTVMEEASGKMVLKEDLCFDGKDMVIFIKGRQKT